MISPRENYLNTFLHKPTVFTPCTMTDGKIIGFGAHNGPWFEKGPEGGGYDGFGVRWVTPESGNGAAIPAPNEFVMEDITEWKDVVKFPTLEGFDWDSYAKDYEELDKVDRSQVLVEFGVGNGCFERLAALMGFENCLISLATEPEACKEFFDALTDYQIEYIRQVKEHLNPDIINYYDDIATERGLFMSPKTYRELIKPYHKKVYDAIHKMGMFVTQHTCGKAQDLVEDFIEIGVDQWCSVQTSNDIQALIEKYGDKITFAGGFDTNGEVARENATPEMIQAEARRVVDDYGKYHKGFALFAFFINSNPEILGRNFGVLFGEFMPYRMQVLAQGQ